MIWDEWTSILTNTQQIKVTQADLTKLAAKLLLEAPQVLDRLQPLLTTLGRLFKAKPPTPFWLESSGFDTRITCFIRTTRYESHIKGY